MSCLVIDMTGSWLMYGVFRQSAKASMQCYIQSSAAKKDRVDFMITPQNAALFDVENDELSFEGVLYDIVGKQQIADTAKITCFMDNDETLLVNDYNHVYSNTIHQKEHASINPFQLFLSVYESPIVAIYSAQCFGLQPHGCLHKNTRIANANCKVVSPPPKVVA